MMAIEDSECDNNGSRINYFSNPDITVNKLPTGQVDTHNNAQTIRDNMVRFLKSTARVSQFEVAGTAYFFADFWPLRIFTFSSRCGRVVLECKGQNWR